jgi:hypothetical protein
VIGCLPTPTLKENALFFYQRNLHKINYTTNFRVLNILLMVLLILISRTVLVNAEEQKSGGGENASNPLAAVNNTDIRWKYFDLDGPECNDFYLDGSYMLHPKLKLKYDLHYWDTDVTGSSESDWESFHLKPIYFPKQGKWGEWKFKLAVGVEWILDFGNEDKGIGSESDQIAPLVGVALMPGGGLVLVPLVQHFVEYDGPDVNQTAFRLIAIQALPNKFWGKLDAKLPVDWENDNAIPATVEVQVGKTFTDLIGAYIDGLFGVGGDRPYDWGVGVGLRFNY